MRLQRYCFFPNHQNFSAFFFKKVCFLLFFSVFRPLSALFFDTTEGDHAFSVHPVTIVFVGESAENFQFAVKMHHTY